MLVCNETGKLIVSKEGYNSKIVDIEITNEEFKSIGFKTELLQ